MSSAGQPADEVWEVIRMPDSEREKLERDELIEALSDRLDGMDEEDFDLLSLIHI